MDLLLDTLYQRYWNSIYMVTLIMAMLFPCASLLFLQLSFIPVFLLILTAAVFGFMFVVQILTIQKRE